MIISDKDWRYKIALDPNLKQDVIDFANHLPHKERKAMLAEIDFYSRHFSLDQVLGTLPTLTDDKQYANFVKYLQNHLDSLLLIPAELQHAYEVKISKLKPAYQEVATFLLGVGLRKRKGLDNKCMYRTVLGSFYAPTIAKIKKYAKRFTYTSSDKLLEEYAIRNSLEQLQRRIAADPSILNLWGKNNQIDYTLKFNNSFGYGKFRSNITSSLDNTFTVNAPDGKAWEQDVTMQYLTNVYPGYGNLCNIVLSNTNERMIDMGANYIINGWSTFAAWHILPSVYVSNQKCINSKVVAAALNGLDRNNCTNIHNLLRNHFPVPIADKILMQLTQMPGKYESRFLGAIATEIVIDRGYAISPINYLNRLSQVNIVNRFTSLRKLK